MLGSINEDALLLVIGMCRHGEGDHRVLLTSPFLGIHSDPAHQGDIVDRWNK